MCLGWVGGWVEGEASLPERGVQEPTNRVSHMISHFLRQITQESRKRDQSDEIEEEDRARAPIKDTGEETKRHEEEEDVEVFACCLFGKVGGWVGGWAMGGRMV